MPPDVDSRIDLNGVFSRALTVNPFLDNRVNGPSKDGADSHETRDHNSEPSDQIAYHRGLVRIVVTLPDYAYV